ncbi:hypothetical protein BU16DRAFT_591673 [Lophium mytilinum]|uniref:Uncharacterized protein n=1 Tax=Lophium mytilinum TaxID=390894 RepID=A0A6A6QLQ2_9PEZI|nr:hypothetical protein BU16DRAFT_591673 [Lophium mytilinum]
MPSYAVVAAASTGGGSGSLFGPHKNWAAADAAKFHRTPSPLRLWATASERAHSHSENSERESLICLVLRSGAWGDILIIAQGGRSSSRRPLQRTYSGKRRSLETCRKLRYAGRSRAAAASLYAPRVDALLTIKHPTNAGYLQHEA